jgi:hypothetical protein
MLDQIDVDRGATEEAGADGGKERQHWTVVKREVASAA